MLSVVRLTHSYAVSCEAHSHLHYECEPHTCITTVRPLTVMLSVVRLTHIYIMSVRLTRTCVTTVRLTYSYAMGCEGDIYIMRPSHT